MKLRRNTLRQATETLVEELDKEIEANEKKLESLRRERELLLKKLNENE